MGKRGASTTTLEELLEEAKRRSILFLILVLTIAYFMSLTSDSLLFNVPIAIVLLAVARRISLQLVIRWRPSEPESESSKAQRKRLSPKDPLLVSKPSPAKWKPKIGSPPVEAAIDEFTQKIVAEFVTDLWYSNITRDQEVPQELRAIINGVIGEVSARVKQVNLINLLTRDIVNLVASHLELYREIQTSIGSQYLETLSSEDRDQKIKEHLVSVKKLHPAVNSLETECQVLQKLMGGVLAIIMRPEDANCKLVRCLARELLACSVMRPVMNFANPRFINEAIAISLRNGFAESKAAAPLPAETFQADLSSNRPAGSSSAPGVELAEVGRFEDEPLEERISSSNKPVFYPARANAVKFEPGQMYTARSGDWAHAIDAFNQRKTQALAPEHLDNLWTKGRNYKKKDAKKLVAGAGNLQKQRSLEETPNVEISQEGMSELKDLRRGGENSSSERLRALDDDYYGKSKEHSRVIVVGEDSIGVRNATGVASVSRVIHHPLELPQESREESSGTLGHRRSLSSGDFAPEKFSAAPKKQIPSNNTSVYRSKLSCKVIGAHYEKSGSKSFAVYSISVSDDEQTWVVLRRYRNFEQLHRRLRDMPHYSLALPPKRFLSSNIDNAVVRERCISLNKYLKDLLSIPSIAELHEVWDFLSAKSQNYGFGDSMSIIKTLAVNVDDAVDDVFRQIKGVSEGVLKTTSVTSSGSKKSTSFTEGNIATGSFLPPGEAGNSDDEGEVEYGTGWHSDSEVLQKSGSAMLGVSFSDGHSPVESIAESELAEDDNSMQEWNPPKLTVPLLNLVNVVFQLEERGWLRRQVLWIARQVLQLGMSDAIDDWLLSKVQCLRKEETVVSGIKLIQEALWPDGTFFLKHPKFRPSGTPGKPPGVPQLSFEEQLEAARRAMVVRDLLQDRAPIALTSLIGGRQYRRCAGDIYGFIQSSVCVKQLAYSLLEKLLAAAFPELEDLISELQSNEAW